MREAALALLVASTGCNWVFGLTATVNVDANPDSPDAPDAPPDITSRLVWGIVTTDGVGVPDATIELVPIGSEVAHPDKPIVQIGPPIGTGPLMDVGYAPADGAFAIPYTLRQAPHRIVYSMPGESLQHEFQWAITGATIVIPRLTRKNAPVPPADSGYHVTPTGLVNAGTPAIFTSGAFTFDQRPASFVLNGGEMTYPFASRALPLAGPVGAPQSSAGDWEMVAAWAARTQYTSTLEGFAIFSLDLADGGPTTPGTQPTWVNSPQRNLSTGKCPGVDCFPTVGIANTEQRMMNTLGGLAGSAFKYRMLYGMFPSLKTPGFAAGSAPDFVGVPMMMPFAQSTNIDAVIDVVDPNTVLTGFDRAYYAHIGTTRTTNGVGLLSYVQAVTNIISGQLQFNSPLVKSVMLGDTNLSDTSDSVPHPASSQPIDLRFASETTVPDEYVVTLYEIAGNALAPIRVYHVLDPKVQVDSSLLVTGHTYVFGITTHVGIPDAQNGSFEAVTYPFAEARTFPRTFTIVP